MTVIQALHRLGGVASRQVLIRATSRKEFRRSFAAGEIVRDAHGRYALPVADEAMRAANRLSGVVSHRSAALHWGWELKTVPDRPEVTVRRKRNLAKHQADGVELHWADLGPDDVTGTVTGIDRTLVDCMRTLPFDEALAVADSALRHRDITKARMLELADSLSGPGSRQARRVAREATHLAANPFESVLRAIALDVLGLSVEPQVWVGDIGRPDLVDERLRIVVEADSFEFHGRRHAMAQDCLRYNAFVVDGWVVVRFAWEHVMFQPEYVRRVLAAAVEQALARGRGLPAA